MFGNKNTDEPVVNQNNSNRSSNTISNRINHGTVIEGTVDSDSDLRIEGIIRGTLKAQSKVAVGPTGLIEGDIHCKVADIEGRIIGDIEVSEILILKSTAIVEGNIHTAKIIIENGARFDGICNMGAKESKNHYAERTIPAYQEETV